MIINIMDVPYMVHPNFMFVFSYMQCCTDKNV
ncbi:MAG: hypothetical protein K0S01_2148 [Herbinix sp.]|jgi:hypothetical protein|nr:hypothetical protein [Herbinix sp.]